MKQDFAMLTCFMLCLGILQQAGHGQSESENQASSDPLSAAIVGFQEKGEEVKGMGQKVGALMFAELATSPSLVLVEREEIDKALEEIELSLSGVIDPASATTIGRMTGAKILISGSVMQLDATLYVIAKIIGTETSRVMGASAKGSIEKGLDPLVEKVAKDITETISRRSTELLPKPKDQVDRIATMRKKIGNADFPTISIKISEQHLGQRTIDPAAEAELMLICKELGFTVLDSSSSEGKKAAINLTGEGLAEMVVRRKNLVAVKARLELKAIDSDSMQVLASDRQTTMSVDLVEQIAGKSALQQAALEIAERLIPKMIEARKKLGK